MIAVPEIKPTSAYAVNLRLAHRAVASDLNVEFNSLYDAIRPSVTLVYRSGGNGAGIIWRSDGLIVTNGHVVNPDGKAQVVLADGRKFVGIVAARHPTRDLAVLKIAANDLPAVRVGDSSALRAGQIVAAVGHPLGFRDSMTAGIIVSAPKSSCDANVDQDDLVRTDAQFARGNSGGPLVTTKGEVVGICTRVSGRLGMAVPSNTVADIVS